MEATLAGISGQGRPPKALRALGAKAHRLRTNEISFGQLAGADAQRCSVRLLAASCFMHPQKFQVRRTSDQLSAKEDWNLIGANGRPTAGSGNQGSEWMTEDTPPN